MILNLKAKPRTTTENNIVFVYPKDNKTALQKLDVVDVDKLPNIMGKPEREMKLKGNKGLYSYGQYLKDDVFQILQYKLTTEKMWGTIWIEDGIKIVTVEDMVDILQENYLSSQLVDGFTAMLRNTPSFDVETMFFMPSTCHRDCADAEGRGLKTNYITDLFVWHGRTEGKLVIFPMCTKGHSNTPFHWTNLVFDGREDGSWKFYNSMTRRNDRFLSDATEMVRQLPLHLLTCCSV